MKNKVVFITGGSSGIGKALAFHFGSNGSKIIITGRDSVKLNTALTELHLANIDAISIVSDVSIENENKIATEKAILKYGKIDILINNAGISMRALFNDASLEVLKKVLDINFYGTVYATKYALPEIIKNKGSIIGISSIAGYRGLPGRTGYSASKFAMHGFLESLRTELLKKEVHILVACPGFTTSNIRNAALNEKGESQGESPRDEGKMMSSEEVAARIYNATIRKKRDLILTTQGKFTVFMNKFFPSFMDKMVYNVMAKETNSPFV